MTTLRDQPHYLKPLKTTKVPTRLAFFDVATTSTRKGLNREITWACGTLATSWLVGKRQDRRENMQHCPNAETLWKALDMFCVPDRRTVLWTFDLPERLRTSEALRHLPEMGWRLETVVLEPGASWALWRDGKRSLLMCDLKSWTPYDWQEVIERMGAVLNDDAPAPAGLTRQAIASWNRCRVLRVAVRQILDWIIAEDLGGFKPTGSGQSYAAFRRRFMTDRLLVHDDVQRLEVERQAMWTGRAEAWRHGQLSRGPFIEIDMRTAYSRIASQCNVPTMAMGEIHNPTVKRILESTTNYAYLCHCQIETEVECVPTSAGANTIWPVGKFATWLWEPELRIASTYCSSVHVTKAYKYRVAPALEAFATHVLDSLTERNMDHGAMPLMVQKHWSRTLVGRFGLRYRSWIPFCENDPGEIRMVTYIDYDDRTMSDLMCVGDTMMLLGDLTESPESMPQIPGWIMSECRARLWSTMCEVGLDRVVYVDTDSMIIDCRGDRSYGRAIVEQYEGAWAQKGLYHRMHIYGPRNIRIDDDRRISGLPLAATQRGPLEFTGEIMRSVKQSMRNGQLGNVVVTPRMFRYDALDTRRGHNPDGSTFPFTLGRTVEHEG